MDLAWADAAAPTVAEVIRVEFRTPSVTDIAGMASAALRNHN